MQNITFIGSVDSNYKRGKDKTKRKRRGLLSTGIAATTGGLLGAKVGSELGQTGLIANQLKKAGIKNGYKFNLKDKVMSHGFGKFIIDNLRDPNNAKELASSKKSQRLLKVYNKARLRGGIKGAAIGTGIAGGTALAINKFRNRKDK